MLFVSVPTKQDFDWLRAEMVGFIRTQAIAAAATLPNARVMVIEAFGRTTPLENGAM